MCICGSKINVDAVNRSPPYRGIPFNFTIFTLIDRYCDLVSHYYKSNIEVLINVMYYSKTVIIIMLEVNRRTYIMYIGYAICK